MSKDIKTITFEALGYASMCWNPKLTVVFDSVRAAEKGNELMEAINEYAKQQAISFNEWAYKNGYAQIDNGANVRWESPNDMSGKTSEELYQLFEKQSFLEQNK